MIFVEGHMLVQQHNDGHPGLYLVVVVLLLGDN